ncbi:hypothetical protein [Pseudomonas sp. D3-10]|uniref:hypothetical protein n=1 Tax=Pseudomonas sp. D3-10 TaxID=2817392 RepID=UPI003DAA26B2
MESVKRYRFKGAAGEYVYAGDFDNAARCFLDATERCLAAERREQALQQRLTVQDQQNDQLRSFASEMISACFEGGSFDGSDIQDIAVKHGVLRVETREDECGEGCACREYGFPADCYRRTELIALNPTAEAVSHE